MATRALRHLALGAAALASSAVVTLAIRRAVTLLVTLQRTVSILSEQCRKQQIALHALEEEARTSGQVEDEEGAKMQPTWSSGIEVSKPSWSSGIEVKG